MAIPWFRHPSNSFNSDTNVNLIIDKFGIEGFGRLYLLREVATSVIDDIETVPIMNYSVKKWALLFKCKSKKAIQYLEHLDDIDEINLVLYEEYAQVSYPRMLKFISKRAVSSSRRGSSKSPNEEEDNSQSSIKKEEESRSSLVHSENSFESRVREILVDNKIGRLLPAFVKNHFRKNFNQYEFNWLKQEVEKRFSSSEKSENYKNDILIKINKEFSEAQKIFEKKIVREQRAIEEEDAKRRREEIRANSPEKADERCSKIWDDIKFEREITIEDKKYFSEAMASYYKQYDRSIPSGFSNAIDCAKVENKIFMVDDELDDLQNYNQQTEVSTLQ